LEDLKQLYSSGVDFVMMPHWLGGSWMAKVLAKQAWNKQTFDVLKREQKMEM